MALDFPDSPSNGDYYNGFVYNSTTGTWKIGGLGTLDLTGGDFTGTQGGYEYHIFTTVGSADLTVSGQGLCDYLVIAGGGAGGTASFGGGGGGAGGLVMGSKVFSTGSYAVTVGAGGVSGASSNTDGGFGSDSAIAGIVTAKGGGGGAGAQNDAVGGGGSGGGGRSVDTASGKGATPFEPYAGIGNLKGSQGHSGGDAQHGTDDRGGGGGGAGSPSNRAGYGNVQPLQGIIWLRGTSDEGSGGGIGLELSDWLVDVNAITAGSPDVGAFYTDAWYIAAGGSGGVAGNSPSAGSQYGGGGAGGGDSFQPTSGVDYTGSGGGGSTDNDVSGSGGSGVVIVRYAI